MPAPYEWRDKIDAWIDRMGYHYVIEESRIPKTARIGESVAIVVTVNNVGVAPIYQPIPLKIKLSGKQEELFETDIDVREIMPGVSKLELCLMLPNDIEAGEYRVNVGILGEGYPTVYFATDAPYCDGYYEIGNISIV